MGTEKQLNTRIQLKYDSFANWASNSTPNKGANLVLKAGEVGICQVPSATHDANGVPTEPPAVLFKVGDGTHSFAELPWGSGLAADVYPWAKKQNTSIDQDGTDGHKIRLKFYDVNDANPIYSGWVTIPDNDTTYSAGSGLELDANNVFNHKNKITAGTIGSNQSPLHGGSFVIPSITYDDQGHISAVANAVINLPNASNDNQKIKVGSTTFGANAEINFIAGANMSIVANSNTNTITFSPSYAVATASADGLMAHADKSKLDEINSTIANAVEAGVATLDGNITGTPSTAKTFSSFTQKDGVVNATVSLINIPSAQVYDFNASVKVIKVDAAVNADYAANAGNATHAVSADSATNASHATSADSATNATYASSANTANTASVATKVGHSLTAGEKTFDGSADVTITAEDLGLSGALVFKGITTTDLTDGATTNPINLKGGTSLTAVDGNVVITDSTGVTLPDTEFVWANSKWNKLGDAKSYKVVQEAKSDPTASGKSITFIASISQNTNGEITATKSTVNFDSVAPAAHNHDANYAPIGHNHAGVYKPVQTAVADPTSSGKALDFITSISQDVNGVITASKSSINLDSKADVGHNHDSAYKPKQEAKSDPSASGKSITFIASVSQDVNGVITASKSTVNFDSVAPAVHNHDANYAPIGHNHAGVYKPVQTAVNDPTASGNSLTFIASVSQDTNGVITATKSTVNTASIVAGLDGNAIATAAANNKYHVLTGVKEEDGIISKESEVQLEAIAKTGNVNDLIQSSGDVLVFNCGSSTDVI